MKKIAIVGSKGYVGKAMVEFFRHHYEVVEIDRNDATELADDCDLAVICVPTPMNEDGSCDWSIVENRVKDINAPVIWIRSTVPPGTTDYLSKKYDKRIVFSPEYIGEGKYWQPYKFNLIEVESEFWVLGGHREDCTYILDLIVPIAGPTKKYRCMKSIEAEVVKYMENIYFAVKVTFANEMRNACKALGVDYWTVRDGWALDPRVDPMHTAAFPEAPGFGGKCLPKDLNGFIQTCEQVGYSPKFLWEVWNSNKRFRGES